MFEGRTQAQKEAVAEGIVAVSERNLVANLNIPGLFLRTNPLGNWFTGGESQTEINERRKKESFG